MEFVIVLVPECSQNYLLGFEAHRHRECGDSAGLLLSTVWVEEGLAEGVRGRDTLRRG